MSDHQRNIFRALTQRRQFYGKYAEPVEEIGSELTFIDHLNEIPVCSADHAYIGLNRGTSAQALELPFLNGPKGRVTGLQLDPDSALWAATEGGLSQAYNRLKDGRIATLTSRNALPCDGKAAARTAASIRCIKSADRDPCSSF
jgi:hypothetical protein